MHFTIERRMLLGFGFVVFLLLFITAISFQVSARQRDLDRQVEYSHRESLKKYGAAMEQEENRLLKQRSGALETYRHHTDMLFLFLRFLMLASLIAVFLGVRATHKKAVATIESISDAFFALDANWNFTYVNGQAEVLLKMKREELLGKNIWQIFPDLEETNLGQQYHRAIKENIKVQFESFHALSRCWLEVVAYPSSEGLSVYFRDVTERKAADERFRVLFEYSSDAHLLFDETGIVDCNRAAIQMLGCEDKSAVLALHPAVLSPEFQPDGTRSEEKCLEMDRLARVRGYHRFEWTHQKTDGTDFPVEVTLTPVLLNGKDTLLTVWHDLTERKQMENALRASETRMRDMVENLPAGAIFVDGERILFNRAAEEMTGYSREEIPTVKAWFRALHHDKANVAYAQYAQDKAAGFPSSPVFPIFRKDGTTRQIQFAAYAYANGEVWLIHDLTERIEAEAHLGAANKQLEYQMRLVNEQAVELEAQKAELEEANQHLTALATTDGLTGLYNHRAFQEKLTAEFAHTQRYQTPLSILLLDVDKFKTYNDTFGHPQGDSVLKTVAKVLQEMVRDTDYVCRYGGEEFVIVLPNTDGVGALAAAERFRIALERHPWTFRPVTASFGVSTFYTDLPTAQELIVQADTALYASKKNGRNRATHYVDIAELKEPDELEGNTSLPYSDIVQEMLKIQQDTLTSASEQRPRSFWRC